MSFSANIEAAFKVILVKKLYKSFVALYCVVVAEGYRLCFSLGKQHHIMLHILLLSVGVTLTQKNSVFLIKAFKVFAVESIPYLLHKLVIEVEIMKNAKTHTESFLCLNKVSYISS